MLPPGAFAVVLILGGAQIVLPAPAFVEQGRVWAPAREVLQRLGLKVAWQSDRRALVALRGEQELVFPETAPPWVTPTTPAQALYARRVGNILYIPLLALRSLRLKTMWDPTARRVIITDPVARSTALAAILNNPAQWLGRAVILTGEYSGWDGDPFCYATQFGPPVASGDWVLANEDGSIYCTPSAMPAPPAHPGLTAARLPSPLLTPYHALGRRLKVSGQIALSAAGVPYLRYDDVVALAGAEGVSCQLILNEYQRSPGQTLSWEVVIFNPGPTSLALPQQREMLVSIAAPGGVMHMLKQSYTKLTIAGSIGAEDEIAIPGAWAIPADAPSGTYSITVRLDDILRTSVRRFEVVQYGAIDRS